MSRVLLGTLLFAGLMLDTPLSAMWLFRSKLVIIPLIEKAHTNRGTTEANLLVAIEQAIKDGADVNEYTSRGHCALTLATSYGYIEIVKSLLKNHADIDQHEQLFGCTALSIAAFQGNMQLVELFIAHHADVNHQAYDGHTALIDAAQSGNSAIIDYLLQHGADVSLCDSENRSAIDSAKEQMQQRFLTQTAAGQKPSSHFSREMANYIECLNLLYAARCPEKV